VEGKQIRGEEHYLYLDASTLSEGSMITAETEDKVERGLLLDIVVRQGATILQLLPGKDQAKEHRLESNIRALEGASLAHRCWSGGMLLWCIVVSDKWQRTHILTHPSLS